jgi:hypothetical protein
MPTCDGSRPTCELGQVASLHLLHYFKQQRQRKVRQFHVLHRAMKRGHFVIIRRTANIKRDRSDVLRKIARMGDDFFKRMFRLDRATFYSLLTLIRPKLESDQLQAERSSGSPVVPVIKLAIALRYLAGGSYLDLVFAFCVSHKHVMPYVWQVVTAIDASLDNIKFSLDDEVKLRELEQGFSALSRGVFPGTVAAGDGVVFRMKQPSAHEVDGDVSSFFTRKGYFAYGMQGFVDDRCRFLSISMKVCSSTHDSTAYLLSDLSAAIRAGKLPEWAHIVLDEAYPCRQQELSPFRGRSLEVWQDSFNCHLSLHRQCVERGFGLMWQRWGVLWRALRIAFSKIPPLIPTICKLHNLCIDSFGAHSPV